MASRKKQRNKSARQVAPGTSWSRRLRRFVTIQNMWTLVGIAVAVVMVVSLLAPILARR